MKKSDIQTLLREGIAAARAGQPERPSQSKMPHKRIYRIPASKADQRKRARQILMRVIELDETNIPAWLWLSSVVEDLAQKRHCLQKVLALEPDNRPAKAGLARLKQQAGPPKSRPAGEGAVTGAKPGQKEVDRPCCPFCKQPISIMATTCRHCSLALVIDCPACGARIDVEQKTCSQCGQPLGNFRQGAAYFAGLARAYQGHQQHRKALVTWQAVESLDSGYPDLYLHLGEAQAATGHTEAAISSLRRVLERDPDQLTASLALGKIYHQSHRWDKARTVYTQALAASPASPQVHFALGWLLMERGKANEALTHIGKATQLDPQHGLAWFHLGQLYELSQKSQRATYAYRRAVALLTTDIVAGKKAQRRLAVLDPVLPRILATGWLELTRQVTGPILICVLAALLDAGLRPWWIPWTGWGALFLGTLGTFLWVSGTTVPYNPVIRLLVGEQGLSSAESRLPIALFGGFCWLFALGVILFPLGQSLPEMPL